MTDLFMSEVVNDLWAYIADHITQPSNKGCRHWTGTHHEGRPILSVYHRHYRVSRIMLEAKLGRPIAPGLNALHTCDDEGCIAFDHIYEGSQAQNMRDMDTRNRRKNHINHRGEAHEKAKLNDEAVRIIRASSLSNRALASQFGVDPVTIWQVKTGKTWRHVV